MGGLLVHLLDALSKENRHEYYSFHATHLEEIAIEKYTLLVVEDHMRLTDVEHEVARVIEKERERYSIQAFLAGEAKEPTCRIFAGSSSRLNGLPGAVFCGVKRNLEVRLFGICVFNSHI